MLLLCYYQLFDNVKNELTTTRINKRFPCLESDDAPSCDLITTELSPFFLCLGDRHDKTRVYKEIKGP